MSPSGVSFSVARHGPTRESPADSLVVLHGECLPEANLMCRLVAAESKPNDPTAPRNERAIRNKPALVKKCLVVRRCGATSREPVDFGLEEPARGPFVVRILLISARELGLHIVCNFGGQVPFRWSFLDFERSRKKCPKASGRIGVRHWGQT